MNEQGSAILGSWVKTAVMIGCLVVHALAISFYVGLTVAGLNAKIDAGNTLQVAQAAAFSDLKSEMRSSNDKLHTEVKEASSELKGDIKELSAIGMVVGKMDTRLSAVEHEVQVLDERTTVIRSKPSRGE